MKKTLFILLFTLLSLATTHASGKIPALLEAGDAVKLLSAADSEEESQLVVLDARPEKQFLAGTVPGAIMADYSKLKWRVKKDKLPGFLPSKAELQDLVRFLGIDEDTESVLILYGADDKSDFGTAARIYWTLKVAGIERVSIINGGLKALRSAGLVAGKGSSGAIPSDYELDELNLEYYVGIDEVSSNLKSRRFLAMDARPENQFEGYAKHKASKSGGTIPGSRNVSQFDFLTPEGALRSKEKIQSSVSGIDFSEYEGVISFCNTGHWAATDWFVISEVLGHNAKLYDGSLVEWTAADRPLERTKNRIQIWLHEMTNG